MTKTNTNITPAELYKLTLSRDGQKMSELVGKPVTVQSWAVSDSVNTDGEIITRTGVMVDGVAYITNSRAFSERLLAIAEYLKASGLNDDGFLFEVCKVRAKSGREYTSCELVF